MHRLRWTAAVIAAASLTVGVGALEAQSYRTAIGVFGGGTWTSALAPDAAADPRLPTGWNAGLEFEHWVADGRFGLRMNGSFSEVDVLPWTTDVNLYTAGAGLMLRLLSPRDGRILAPFLSLGAAGVHYNFSDVLHFDRTPSDPDVLLRTDPVTRPAVTAGLGFDLVPGTGVGLRFEGVDRLIFQSPFVDDQGTAYGMVHNLRYSASLQVRFGRLPGAPVLAAAPPPADAPSEPTPRAEPEEDEEEEEPRRAVAEPPVEPEPEPDSAPDPRELPTSLAAETPSEDEDEETETADRSDPTSVTTDGADRAFFTVQVAAFEDPASARRLAERMRRNDLPAWITEVRHAGRIYHRVRVGAVPSEPEARQLGERLRTTFSTPVWVVPFEQSSAEVSDTVVRATRTFIRGS
ncbi:MAG: SPOR domain-containing protein [Gemmatimonadota bacterium]